MQHSEVRLNNPDTFLIIIKIVTGVFTKAFTDGGNILSGHSFEAKQFRLW